MLGVGDKIFEHFCSNFVSGWLTSHIQLPRQLSDDVLRFGDKVFEHFCSVSAPGWVTHRDFFGSHTNVGTPSVQRKGGNNVLL